jgi:hypothetical protein
MKELEDDFWKEEILKDFNKPTHQGFTEEIMQQIELANKPLSNAYEPLISPKQWLITACIALAFVIFAVLFDSKIQIDLGYFETLNAQFIEFLQENTSLLWISFSLVSFFFVFSFIKKGLFFVK